MGDRDRDHGEPAPEIKRPRGATWRRLEAEGIVWEGQVVLLGEESDLAARLVVTKRRLAFVRGGAVALELGREWLTPPPLLLPDGTLGLSVTLEDAATENLFVQAREGRRVAGHLVTLLGGSSVRRPQPTGGAGRSPSARPAEPRRNGQGTSRPVESPFSPSPSPAASSAPLPGPLFPDDVAPAAGGSAFAALSSGLPTRPDTSPPPYEPSWARPRRDRLDPLERSISRSDDAAPTRESWSDPIEPPERVSALLPDERPIEPARRQRFTDAAIEVLSPATAFGSTRPRATGDPGQVVPAPAPLAGVGRHADWNLQPMRGIAPRAARRRRRQEWLARLLGLLILALFTAVAISAQTGNPLTDPDDREPTVGPSPAAVAQNQPTATATIAATATHDVPAAGANVLDPAPTEPDAVPAQTAQAIGVGGPAATETEASAPAPTSALPNPPAATDGAGGSLEDPNDDLSAAGTTGDPAEAAAAPTATEELETTATEEAAPTATAEPESTATEEPASTATDEPTAEPTAESTAAPAVETDASGQPATDEPESTNQSPSLANGEIPAQTFASGPFRFSIVAAVRSASVPDLELYDYGTGEWVALFVDVANWTQAPATLVMPEFVLGDASRTAPIALDTGTALIARTFGLDASYVHDAQVPYAPGEQHRILLLYLVTPEATDLVLRTNEAAVQLDDILAEEFVAADLPAEDPIVPELVPAFVTAVIDGQTIEVSIDGLLYQVRYLGIDVPVNTDCWALESTQANINLVIGQTVWLERQRSNEDRQGRLLRDVWVLNWDGTYDLVAERLVAQGAAEPATTVPNTRLTDWLDASSADAAAVGAGRWGFCPVADGGIGVGPVLATLLPFVFGMVWVIMGTPGLDSLMQRRPSFGGRHEDQPEVNDARLD